MPRKRRNVEALIQREDYRLVEGDIRDAELVDRLFRGDLDDDWGRFDGVVHLAAGTLYAALDRLVAQGWIEALDERPDPELGSTRWRYFRITPAGRVALTAEIGRLEKLVRTVRALELVDQEIS